PQAACSSPSRSWWWWSASGRAASSGQVTTAWSTTRIDPSSDRQPSNPPARLAPPGSANFHTVNVVTPRHPLPSPPLTGTMHRTARVHPTPRRVGASRRAAHGRQHRCGRLCLLERGPAPQHELDQLFDDQEREGDGDAGAPLAEAERDRVEDPL